MESSAQQCSITILCLQLQVNLQRIGQTQRILLALSASLSFSAPSHIPETAPNDETWRRGDTRWELGNNLPIAEQCLECCCMVAVLMAMWDFGLQEDVTTSTLRSLLINVTSNFSCLLCPIVKDVGLCLTRMGFINSIYHIFLCFVQWQKSWDSQPF